MTEDERILETALKLLDEMELEYERRDGAAYFAFPPEQGAPVWLKLGAIEGYWVYVTTVALMSLPEDEELAVVTSVFHRLLRANDRTKLGRFYIDARETIQFAVDFRAIDLSERVLGDVFAEFNHVLSHVGPEMFATAD